MQKERGQLPTTVIFHVTVLIQQTSVEPGAVSQVLCWAPGIHGRNEELPPSESSLTSFWASPVLMQLEIISAPGTEHLV